MRIHHPSILITLMIVFTTMLLPQERDRNNVPDQYKWDLTDIYTSDAEWRTARDKFAAELPSLETYRGSLVKSAARLLECLELSTRLVKDYARLYVYAELASDLDTRNASYLGMQQEITQIGTSFNAKVSFIEPEILSADRRRVDEFLRSEPKLKIYEHYLDDILRRKNHTGTDEEEKIIADAGLMADAPGSIFGIFADADFPYPSLTLSDSTTVKLDKAAFFYYRTLPNREDRKAIFASYFGSLDAFHRTFGTQINAQINRNLFYMRARKYTSCLESALDANNIPIAVYHALIQHVNANLATFHRYLNLRKRMLGVDELHYYDLYAPLVGGIVQTYPVEDAKKHILAALKPLGGEYTKVVEKAFAERWIDLYPTTGKRSGAYSNGGAYEVHPYMLLNYNNKYDDMSTLAHELGHTMHSHYANTHQPYATAGYPIFVAEVASTFNEALLIDHMLKTITDDNVRLALLGNYLEGIKGTVFRQTQFAEFELRIHELAERGEPITGERLNEIYMEITRKYYGHDMGVCIVDDEIKSEWANVPHFYTSFYVYQYATAFTASAALSEQVLAGDRDATRRFISFLSAGGSDYPMNLLTTAGVDMTASLPFDLTMQKMNRVIAEMENILDRRR